jgi:hypothetical protein
MIELLPPEEWHQLEAIFEAEWAACLPNPEHAMIVVERDGDELIGFCILETLIRPGNFYVSERHRNNGTVRRLVSYIESRARASGRSFVALADQPRYEKLFQSLGMRAVGTAFRRDFFNE